MAWARSRRSVIACLPRCGREYPPTREPAFVFRRPAGHLPVPAWPGGHAVFAAVAGRAADRLRCAAVRLQRVQRRRAGRGGCAAGRWRRVLRRALSAVARTRPVAALRADDDRAGFGVPVVRRGHRRRDLGVFAGGAERGSPQASRPSARVDSTAGAGDSGRGRIGHLAVLRAGRHRAPRAGTSRRRRGAGVPAAVPGRLVRRQPRGFCNGRGLMRIHILGICGTFMGGIAALARELGIEVEGSDANVYPPMSDQLRALGITLQEGWSADHLQSAPDAVVVGNALSRGNPSVEYMLNEGLRYVSGPQWLGENVLRGRAVLAVAGTHGKTTTTSLLAHLLDSAGLSPGFLIGGVPGNFGVSARLGAFEPLSPRERGRGEGSVVPGPASGAARHLLPGGEGRVASPSATPFVLEADEYDTAFFDKRSKFVHYRPRIAILNNLEYDHADIFPDLAAIQRQFHHLVRTVPGNGRLIVNAHEDSLAEVLAMGCWTPVETFGIGQGDWQARLIEADGSVFVVHYRGEAIGEVRWSLLGNHSVLNALAALAAASAAGADPRALLPAFASFQSVKRRMELVGEVNGVRVYDDFAHHPTAIATTLAGLRAKVGEARILVALEPRSNSMRLGAHAAALAPSLADADAVVFLHRPELPWDVGRVTGALQGRGHTAPTVAELIEALRAEARPGDHVVFMSNGGFENAPRRFAEALG